jgi:hypothetical protein
VRLAQSSSRTDNDSFQSLPMIIMMLRGADVVLINDFSD